MAVRTAPADLGDIVVRHWMIVLYGKPGVGKSVLAATSRKYRTFVFDVDGHGVASVKAYVVRNNLKVSVKVWPVVTQDDLMAGWAWLLAHRTEFDLVVFDSATEYQAMARRAAFKTKLADPRQGWGVVLDAMDLITSQFKAMPWHVIVVCHETMKEDAVTKQPEYRPAFQGDWKYQYARHFDEILRYTMWLTTERQGDRMVVKVNRWLDCGPNPLIQFKDRSGILNKWEPVDIDRLLDKLIGSQTGADGLAAAVLGSAEQAQPEDPGEQQLNKQEEENNKEQE